MHVYFDFHFIISLINIKANFQFCETKEKIPYYWGYNKS